MVHPTALFLPADGLRDYHFTVNDNEISSPGRHQRAEFPGMMAFLRTWFALMRPAALPTIWSNCLAGWWLGGAGNQESLPFLFSGATLLYLGGAFLNDAFDAKFDKKHRRMHPIPSGAVGLQTVWNCGFACIAIGVVCLYWIGETTGALGVALALCIIAYDAIHRALPLSTALLGSCRVLLYLVAASVAIGGVTGWAIWCGLVMATYVVAAQRITRPKMISAPGRYWTLVPLTAPVLLALLMNDGPFRQAGLLLSAVLVLWCARVLRPLLWSEEKDIKRAAAGLLAGIVLVDLLAAANAPREIDLIFLGLFGAVLLLQLPTLRKVP